MLLAALPKVAVAILGKFVSEKFLQDILEDIFVWSLKKLAPLTTNTLDDELVEIIIKRLKNE